MLHMVYSASMLQRDFSIIQQWHMLSDIAQRGSGVSPLQQKVPKVVHFSVIKGDVVVYAQI